MTKTSHAPKNAKGLEPGLLFAGAGEMRARCREFDWAATPLGPVEGWSHCLRSTVDTLLACRNPMFLWWGPELVQIYNDAYRPSLGQGDRHPRALGARGREFWTDIWDAIGPQITQVMATGEGTWHEDQYLPIERNGRLEDVWWTYSYSPVRDDDGSIAGTLVVCQETTHRILAERERTRLLDETARAERRATRVLEQVSDEHLTMDANFRILTLNPAAERALGKKREELIGLTHWEAFPASVGSAIETSYRRVMTERVAEHLTHHYVGEGYDRHLEIDIYPTDDGGLALFWREVSERVRAEQALRESERRYRKLFESLDEGFCVIEVLFDDAGKSIDYRFLEANPAFVAQTGIVDGVGRRMRELAPAHESYWFETYGRVALTGEPIRFDAAAAALGRWYDVYAFRIDNPADRHVAVLFKDVGPQRAAAEERERLLAESERARADAEAARADAETANRAKGEFLAVMSHELRTPLNAIGGYAELLEMGLRGPINEQQRGDLARIQQSQKHLLGLINQVLNYTRIETGTVRYELSEVLVNEALAAAEALVVPQVLDKGLTYVLGSCDRLLRVRADGEKLQQILLNVLTNAIKFTDPGGEIRVSCTVGARDVAIAVTDTGVGIAADKLPSIFEPFVQVDQRLTRPHEGVGLGLAISRDLARGMGGDLTAESISGVGSTFTLRLPVHQTVR